MRSRFSLGFVLLLVLSVFAFACGSSPAPSNPTAPASAAPSAAAVPADDGRCLAATTRKRPTSGWREVGQLVIEVQDGQPTSFEARDASGKVVEKKPAPKDRREARELMKTLTCRVGGLLATLDGKEPPKNGTGTATMIVLEPTAPDEKGDVAMLCKEPVDMPGADHALDDQQTVRIAVDFYDERLTTKKWRAWLRDAGERKMQAADELAAAARDASITTPCWFADGLRRHH